MNDSLNVQGHERVGLLSVQLAVVEKDLLTANNYILQKARKGRMVRGRNDSTAMVTGSYGKDSGDLTFLSQPNRFVFLVGSEIQPSSLESKKRRRRR